LRCELVDLVDHPDDLMRGLGLSQGAVVHRHFWMCVPSFSNGGGDARRRSKEKCSEPTADLMRV
jgi:hypothetical protein